MQKTPKTQRALVLQHEPPETPGTVLEVLEMRGIDVTTVRTFEGAPVPKSIGGFDALVVMGGSMSAYDIDKHPHLASEIALLREAIDRDIALMGICLGSQLLASALGARVFSSGSKEIGWHPITLLDSALDDPMWNGVPRSFPAFHWHGDVFDLPDDAVPIASSQKTKLQAFRHGRAAYGFLCHLEVDEPIVTGMIARFGDELRAEKIDAAKLREETKQRVMTLRKTAMRVFSAWADRI